MKLELEIRKTASGTFNVSDGKDPNFDLHDLSEAQLLGYLRHRKLIGTTAEGVLKQLAGNERQTAVHVLIDGSI